MVGVLALRRLGMRGLASYGDLSAESDAAHGVLDFQRYIEGLIKEDFRRILGGNTEGLEVELVYGPRRG